MSRLSVSAVRLVDGREIALDELLEVQVAESLSSPAQSMRCRVAAERFPGDLGTVTVRHGRGVLFTGQMDRQAWSYSAQGAVLALEARSKGALLLDNEALPCVLAGAQLGTVFSRFIAPYGFVLYSPGRGRSLAQYTVNKGVSEWDALSGFTRRAYGRTPYVRGDTVLVERPARIEQLLIGGKGLRFTSIKYVATPYKVLSKIVLRDTDGAYRSAVHNSSAAYYGARRKRYLVPPNEFADSAALDANQRIRQSMLEREGVSVTLPGILDIAAGQEARIDDSALTLSNLLVEQVRWRQGADGATTALELASSLYYD